MDITELQLLGRAYLRSRFIERRAPSDPVVLEAFKSFDTKDEVRVGLCVSGVASSRQIELLFGGGRLTFDLCSAAKRRFLILRTLRVIVGFQLFFAALIAITIWIIDQIRYRTFSAVGTVHNEIFGFYPENATRTRALANHLKGRGADLKQYQVVLLGRPKINLHEASLRLRSLLDSDNVDVIYPVSVGSIPIVLANVVGTAKKLASEFFRLGYVPAFTSILSSLYRLYHGHASGYWARLNFPAGSSCKVWLCHTGLGDTSLLEKVLQHRGVTTLHWVHGVSDGLNFTGVSSIGYFRTLHDVEWHQKLGGYAQCLMQPPTTGKPLSYEKVSKSNFLLCSSYAHPMNLGFRCEGVKYEVEALEIFAEAARLLSGDQPFNMRWKPHPVFYTLPEFQRETLIDKAKSLGFSLQAQSTSLYDLLSDVLYVAATTSTIVFDISDAGRSPVLLYLQSLDPEHSLASVPLKAKTVGQLVSAWKEVSMSFAD